MRRTKPTRGGSRPGAGAKPLYDAPMIRRQVMVDADSIAKAERIGQGNFSAGIREAIRQAREPKQ